MVVHFNTLCKICVCHYHFTFRYFIHLRLSIWNTPIAFRGYNSTFMQAGKTLSVRKWQAAFNPEGQLDISKTLNRIHRGVSSISLLKYFLGV